MGRGWGRNTIKAGGRIKDTSSADSMAGDVLDCHLPFVEVFFLMAVGDVVSFAV